MLPPAPPAYRLALIDRLGIARHISMPTQVILRHLGRWPLRAALTTSGVAMSVMLMVGLFFFFDAIDELVDSAYYRTNRQDIAIGLIDQRNARARFEIARLPGVHSVEPALEIAAQLSHRNLVQRLVITGVEKGAQFRTFHDSSGRPFTLPENGIVLTNKLADLLGLSVGERVEVKILEGTRRTVALPVAGIAWEYVGFAAYMDMGALAAVSGESGSATSFQASVDRAREGALLRRMKDIPAVATIATRAQAISSLREIMAKSMVIVIDFYIALGAIVAFGVLHNAARISLSERGRELASLRVIGFTQGEVSYILLGELALLVLAALPAGCVLGYGLAWFMSAAMETKLFRIPFVISPSTFGIAMTVALASAVASGIAVYRRIGRLDLVAVLKTRE
jgi:putative ABC transport system permease protein